MTNIKIVLFYCLTSHDVSVLTAATKIYSQFLQETFLTSFGTFRLTRQTPYEPFLTKHQFPSSHNLVRAEIRWTLSSKILPPQDVIPRCRIFQPNSSRFPEFLTGISNPTLTFVTWIFYYSETINTCLFHCSPKNEAKKCNRSKLLLSLF